MAIPILLLIAIFAGELVWKEFGMATLSGRYAVREDTWRDLALKIYYHPTHAFNVDGMIRSMKNSLEYFTEQFGPYQYKELRVVEFPRYESFARAHPHTIACSEGDMFLQRVEADDMNLPFYAVAHETAHQWWGGQVSGAAVKGRGLLSEGLANYSAMMVVERVYGPAHARDFYDFQMDRYLRVRGAGARGVEVPLLDVEMQPWIFYAKGAVTPDSLHGLLRDLFEEIILWDVRAEDARVESVGDGSYRVTLTVEANKVRADSIGNETEVSMSDLVEIGVFPNGGKGMTQASRSTSRGTASGVASRRSR